MARSHDDHGMLKSTPRGPEAQMIQCLAFVLLVIKSCSQGAPLILVDELPLILLVWALSEKTIFSAKMAKNHGFCDSERQELCVICSQCRSLQRRDLFLENIRVLMGDQFIHPLGEARIMDPEPVFVSRKVLDWDQLSRIYPPYGHEIIGIGGHFWSG